MVLILDPDSVLVTTAAELQTRHRERDPESPDRCACCGALMPCPVEAAAALVCRAAGLWLEGDTLVDALEPPTQLLALVAAPVSALIAAPPLVAPPPFVAAPPLIVVPALAAAPVAASDPASDPDPDPASDPASDRASDRASDSALVAEPVETPA